jgi:hypothetical protein
MKKGFLLEAIEEVQKRTGINYLDNLKRENYYDEIVEIKKDYGKNKSKKLPFVNQEEVLEKVSRTLNTSYPYVVLVGEPGIGKSLSLDFLVKLIEGDEKLEDYKQVMSPRLFNSIKTLKNKIESLPLPNTYLFPPNYKDFLLVEPWSYDLNKEREEKLYRSELRVLSDSGYSLIDFIDQFIIDEKENIVKLNSISKKPDEKTINLLHEKFNAGLEDLLKKEIKEIPSERVNSWLNDLKNYFKKSKSEFKENMLEISSGLKEYLELYDDDKLRKKYKLKSLEDFLLMEADFIADIKELNVNLSSIRSSLDYMIKIGSNNLFLKELAEIPVLEINNNRRVTRIQDWKNDNYLGIFSYEKEVFPSDSMISLGPLFYGNVLFIKDGFKNFISNFVNNENVYMKEQFLEWLQSGVFEYSLENVKYRFNLPKIIIGADNEDPFLFETGLLSVKREVGVESRFEKIYVDSYKNNTKKVRKGSIEFILSKVDEFNKAHDTDLKIDNDVIEYLLSETIEDKYSLVNLEYRDLEQKIKKLCSFAQMENYDVIDKEILKEKSKEDYRDLYFAFSKRTFNDSENGFLVSHKMNVGQVNGLAALDETFGGVVSKIKSSLVYGHLPVSDRYKLLEINSNLGDETMLKGFDLVKDYVNNYLSLLDKRVLNSKLGWYVSINFDKEWSKSGGPSASTAIAASIISSLGNRPLNKYTFVTGALSTEGFVSEIGGEFEKGAAILNYKKSINSDEDFIYMFPLANYESLEKKLIVDPLGMKENLSLVPVHNFEQVYGIMTKEKWNSLDIRNSYSIGKTTLEKDLENFEKSIFEKYNLTKKKKFFFF